MSDDDFMEEDEEFDFQYSGSEEEEPMIDLENQYYEAKGLKESDPTKAIQEFLKVVELESEMGEWGFKALKQCVKVSIKLQDYDSTLDYYKKLLIYTKSAVTRNASEKSINSILDYASQSQDMTFMEKLYSITLEALQEQKNERLWIKTNLKLAKLWLVLKEHSRLTKIIRQLHQSCQLQDGSDDQQKGTLLLEIFALEIQMYTETKNNKKLKQVYLQCLKVKSAIPHPRIMGLIRECGGKMHMYESEWEKAQVDFFEAFKMYDEAGSPKRIQCLKYLVLANMLMESQINPFDSQETKPFANDPEIVVLTQLVNAFHLKDINSFENILSKNRNSIMNDLFIREYIDDVLWTIRMQVVEKLVKPYTRIELAFISKHLNVSLGEVQDLLSALILDGKVLGKINQVTKILELERRLHDTERMKALQQWSNANKLLCKSVIQV